jgi:cell pole-organizing protein PopZ
MLLSICISLFVFTFEIYSQKVQPSKLVGESEDGRENNVDDKSANTYGFLKPGALNMARRMAKAQRKSGNVVEKQQSDASCLSEFNPMDESTFNDVLQSWTAAYLDVAAQVAAAQSSGANHASGSESLPTQRSTHTETAAEWNDKMRASRAIFASSHSQLEDSNSSSVADEDKPGEVPWDALRNKDWNFMYHNKASEQTPVTEGAET